MESGDIIIIHRDIRIAIKNPPPKRGKMEE